MSTEPVSFKKPTKYVLMMTQTEPEIEEPRFLEEPARDYKPFEDTFSPNVEKLATPKPEEIYNLVIPEPEEDLRDWEESNLYMFIRDETIRKMLNHGQIKLQEREKRPETPEKHKNLSTTERHLLNLK